MIVGPMEHALAATARPCSRCGRPRDVTGRYCRKCRNAYQRERRKRYADMTDAEKAKVKARSTANVYQRRGHLTPQPCEECGTTENLEKHHDDYTKPLEVRWFCRDHHPDKGRPRARPATP